MTAPLSPRWCRVRPLPFRSNGIYLPNSEQHSCFRALACSWRPPETRRQRAPGDLAKGRTCSDARPPLRKDLSSKGVAREGPLSPQRRRSGPRSPLSEGASRPLRQLFAEAKRGRWPEGSPQQPARAPGEPSSAWSRRTGARGGRRKVGVGAAEPGARRPWTVSASHEYA